MKSFNVTVNGNTYYVEVEETAAAPVNSVAPVPVTNTPAPIPTPAPAAPTPSPAPAAGSKPVVSPMPGTILDIKVSMGENVSENQVVAILEAMKMENEVVAPFAGVVTGISVSKGAVVNTGDVLISLGS